MPFCNTLDPLLGIRSALLMFVLFAGCANDNVSVSYDSGAGGDPKSNKAFISYDSGVISDPKPNDVLVGSDSGVISDPKVNQAYLDFKDVFKYLFEAETKVDSLSIYFEPREGYLGDKFYLYCYDSNSEVAPIQADLSERLKISNRNRYLFNLTNLKKDITYNSHSASLR